MRGKTIDITSTIAISETLNSLHLYFVSRLCNVSGQSFCFSLELFVSSLLVTRRFLRMINDEEMKSNLRLLVHSSKPLERPRLDCFCGATSDKSIVGQFIVSSQNDREVTRFIIER